MPLGLEAIYNTQLSLASENAETGDKQNRQQSPGMEQSSPYPKRAPRIPYRWRKLKMTYSAVVLAMYPYLAEPDSDGDDDIAEEEEDDHMRWDPVQGIHVKRETFPTITPIKQSIGTEPITTIDTETSESPVEDGVGVEILLEAAKALFDNGQDNRDIAGDGHTSNASLAQSDGGKVVYEADSFSARSVVLKLSQNALKQHSSLFPKEHPNPKFNYALPELYDYSPTPGREYDLPVVKEQGDLKSKNDPCLMGTLQPRYKAAIAPKEVDSEGLGIEYNSLGFPKIPKASETSKVAKKNIRANSGTGYQLGSESKAPGTVDGVVNHENHMSPGRVGPHPYPTAKAGTQNISSPTSRFNECNPVHRFHNFKHQTDFRRAIITYRRVYDKPRPHVLYKPKPSYKQRNVCGRNNNDQQRIACKEIVKNHFETVYDSSNCETCGEDRYECDDRKILQSGEFTAKTMEEMMVLGYMPLQHKGLCEISKNGINYVGHANLIDGNGIPLRMHNMMRCGHPSVPPKPQNLKGFRGGYFDLSLEPIILDTETYIPHHIQGQIRGTGSRKEYDPEMFRRMLSGGSEPPRKQETFSSMIDELSIPAQESDSGIIGKVGMDSNKSLDKQENLGLLVEQPTFAHDVARDLAYKKSEAAGCQHMMEIAKKLANDIVKQKSMSADTAEPSLMSTSSAATERNLQRAVLGLTPEDIGQQDDVSDRIDSTRKQHHLYKEKNREKGRPWEDHADLLDLEPEEPRQHDETSDRSRREHHVYSKTTRQKRRHHEDSGETKSSPRKRRRHRSISKETEFRDSSRRRRRRHHESRSPRKSHNSSHRRKGGYESDKSRLGTKDYAPDRGRRRHRDLEYDHDHSMAGGSSRNSVTRIYSHRTPSPSPVHLVKIASQQEKTPENNRSTLQGEYSHRKFCEKSSKSRHKNKDHSPHRRHHHSSSHASDSSWDPNAKHNSPSVQAKTTRQPEIIPAKVRQDLLNRWSHPVKKTQEQQGLAQSTQSPRGNGINSFHGNFIHGYRSNNNRGGYRGGGHNMGSRGPTWASGKVRAFLASNEDDSQGSGEIVPEPRPQPLRYPHNSYGFLGLTRGNKAEKDIDIEENGSWGKYRR